MIGTQILQGQGLGNRLFCYVTARSIAEQKKTSFGVPGKEILLNGLTGNNSEPFLDLWMGEEAKPEDFTRVYEEKKNGSTRAPAGMIWSTAAMWREKTEAFSM